MLADVMLMMCMAHAMPNVADGIPLWQMLLPLINKQMWPNRYVGMCGRWNATVTDVIATILLTGIL